MKQITPTERLGLYIEASALNRMVDTVLVYRPPEKAKATKKREKRRRKRVAKKG